jgi:hypothetical protein
LIFLIKIVNCVSYPSSVTLREDDRQKPHEATNTSYTIRKKLVLYLLLEKNRAMPAAGKGIACYTKALKFRNGKTFRRVTEAVHERIAHYGWKKPFCFLRRGIKQSKKGLGIAKEPPEAD